MGWKIDTELVRVRPYTFPSTSGGCLVFVWVLPNVPTKWPVGRLWSSVELTDERRPAEIILVECLHVVHLMSGIRKKNPLLFYPTTYSSLHGNCSSAAYPAPALFICTFTANSGNILKYTWNSHHSMMKSGCTIVLFSGENPSEREFLSCTAIPFLESADCMTNRASISTRGNGVGAPAPARENRHVRESRSSPRSELTVSRVQWSGEN